MKKIFFFIIGLLFLISGCATPRVYEKIERVEVKPKVTRIIVIDPGHGGKAKGAVGPTGLKEKDVVLDVAKRLEKLLIYKGGYKVFLTRREDYDVSLVERRELARKHKADLFVSIHCDGNRDKRWNGTAVYVLSEKGADIVKDRALTNGDYLLNSSVYNIDKSNYLNESIVDIVQTGTKQESYIFAKGVINSLVKGIGTKNLGIKEANFAVLKMLDVPSVLVELAFITNWWEGKLLKEPSFRQRVAEALAKAIEDYFQNLPIP